ncbi:GyrI-like domain-containing protein [Microbacterium aurantiacum]|uniref:GyrI-like domain-containing protein n=1 Tax=Microbacterium aurantiacum TaxID=162393 RepID=A0AAJ2HHY8_9MICO|nr:GyrI-like domain-containing protein [Microbacterium aurantiacum]MDS0244729.1 GyrI-like domain-containing protein [Microbacterium aurantiacum]
MSEFIETALSELHLVQLSARITEMAEVEQEIGPMFQRVADTLDAAGAARVGPGVATYTVEGEGMVAAAAEQIGEAPTPAGLEAVTVAAAPRALTTRYRSADLAGIQQAWQELVAEVERRGLIAAGTCREVYLSTPMDTPGAAWEVDLQQPVR